MGIFDFSDPNTMAILGMAQGLGQASMPSRMPVPFGAALAQGLGGAMQGAQSAQSYKANQMQNDMQSMLLNYYRSMQPQGQMQGVPGSTYAASASSPAPVPQDPSAPQMASGQPPMAPRMPGQGPRQMGAVPFGIPQSGMDPMQMIARGQSMLGIPSLSGTGANLIATGEKMMEAGMVPDGQGGITAIPGYLDFQASKSGATARGEAPYKIAESLASQAGKVDKLAPGEYAVTGMSTMPPEFVNLIRNAAGGGGSQQSYAPQAAAPQAIPQQAAPQRAQAAPSGGQPGVNASGFPVQSPRAYGGGFQNPLSLEGATMQKEILPAQYQEAGKNYSSAQTMLGQLSMIDHSIDALNNQGRGGLTATGTGANTKMALLKGLNSLSATFGGQAFIDPSKVASWEDLNKESTRMGFELAKTLGSREAQMIVQQAISAVPNASNTYLGAKLVSASLRSAAQRQIDYYQYLNDFAMSHGGNTMGADIEFNKAHPVQDYTKNAIIGGLGAKQAPDGKWYAPDPSRPGKYLEVNP